MGLNDSLSIAYSGLSSVQYAISVSSQNTANANTNGYIREQPNVISSISGNIASGVRNSTTTLSINNQIQNAIYKQNSKVSELDTLNNTLSTIASMQGSTSTDPGKSGSLPDQLGNLRASLITLSSSSSNSSYQNDVVQKAINFSQSVNQMSETIQQQRQISQDNIVSTVSNINTDLSTIGSLSKQIMGMKNLGKDTADLENQRFTALSSLSEELSVNWSISERGDMNITTKTGLSLPTHIPDQEDTKNFPISTSAASISESCAYPGQKDTNSIPGIILNGQDITKNLQGGRIGGNIKLRDTVLPTMQAQLDSLAATVANRFQSAGIPIFSGQDQVDISSASSQNNVYPKGIIGFSQQISVPNKYQQNASLLFNDPTNSSVANIISNVFDSIEPIASSVGIGLNKDLSTGYSGNLSLIDLSSSLIDNQASISNNIANSLSFNQDTKNNFFKQFSTTSGVSLEKEMSNIVSLQNSYSANAKVISYVQSMFTSLISAIGN